MMKLERLSLFLYSLHELWLGNLLRGNWDSGITIRMEHTVEQRGCRLLLIESNFQQVLRDLWHRLLGYFRLQRYSGKLTSSKVTKVHFDITEISGILGISELVAILYWNFVSWFLCSVKILQRTMTLRSRTETRCPRIICWTFDNRLPSRII